MLRGSSFSILKDQFSKDLTGIDILDAGCGDSVLTHLLMKEGANTHSIDHSIEAIQFAVTKLKFQPNNFIVGNVNYLPYKDNTFDAVISTEVIEHLNTLENYFKEMIRVTKPSGFILISTPIRLMKDPRDMEHIQEWFVEDFRQLVLDNLPDSKFYVYHPVFFMELMNRVRTKFFINILSFVKNPFESFKPGMFRYFALQYSLSKNSKP